MSATEAAAPAAPARKQRSTATDLALIATFAALIAVCALLPAISVGGLVPITLQTFAVLLAGAVLGAKRGGTKAEGFAREDGEITAGFRSIGVAVRDHVGWPVAAVAITWAEETRIDADAIAASVTDTARELQRRLGYGAR